MMKRIWLVGFLLAGPAMAKEPVVPANLRSYVENIKQMRDFYKVDTSYLGDDNPSVDQLKIAILTAGGTNGLEKLEPGMPEPMLRYLPLSAEAISSYVDEKDPQKVKPGEMTDPKDSRGRRLAQLMWNFMGFPEKGPQFKVYNAIMWQSYSNALRAAEVWEPDVILSTENSQLLGNMNGTGIVDHRVDLVTRRTSSSPIFVQSAGDSFGMTYTGPIQVSPVAAEANEQLLTHDQSGSWYLRLLVQSNLAHVNVTLMWPPVPTGGAFPGTNRDLDICIYPPDQIDFPTTPVKNGCSEVRQKENSQVGVEKLPNERIDTWLQKNDRPYLIAIRKRGGDFVAGDYFRVAVATLGMPKPVVSFIDSNFAGSIGAPGDDRYVVTVGANTSSSSMGPTIDGRQAPQIKMDAALAKFSDDEVIEGSDVAAAIYASMVALMKAKARDLDSRHVKALLAKSSMAKIFTEKESPIVTQYTDGGWKLGMAALDLKPELKNALLKKLEGTAIGVRGKANTVRNVAVFVEPHKLKVFASSNLEKNMKDHPNHAFYVRLRENGADLDGEMAYWDYDNSPDNPPLRGPWTLRNQGKIEEYILVTRMAPVPTAPPMFKATHSLTYKMPLPADVNKVIEELP